MRCQTSDGEDESSSSSSSSSDEEGRGSGDERRIRKKGKKAMSIPWKCVKTPDMFQNGWQYKLSPFRVNDEIAQSWMTDDATLKAVPLGGEILLLFV